MTRRAGAALALAAAFVTSNAHASGVGAGDPWDAADRLYPFSPIGPPGLALRIGAAARRAVEDDLVLRLDAGAEPARGPGVRAGLVLDRAAGAWELGGSIVARGSRGRAAVGGSVLRWRTEQLLSLEGALHVEALPGLLAGAETRVWPGAAAWAPETTWSLHLARASWWGGIALRSRGHRIRAAMGSAWVGGLSWFAAYEDGNPSAGISLDLGRLEFRAAETSHAALGAVSEMSLRFARRAS